MAAENLEEPARVPQHVERGADSRFAGGAIAALVPFTAAEHVGVGCEHQRLVTRRRGTLHDVARDGTVLQHVELHPQPSACAVGDILEPGGRHGAQGERHAEPGGRPRERQVALRVQHAVQAGRGDDERRVGGPPENRRALMARAGVDQGLGDQPQTLQGVAIGAQRHLVFGPALDVLEREARHAAPGNLSQVGDVKRA